MSRVSRGVHLHVHVHVCLCLPAAASGIEEVHRQNNELEPLQHVGLEMLEFQPGEPVEEVVPGCCGCALFLHMLPRQREKK